MSTITKEWLQHAINDYESCRNEPPFGLSDHQERILVALRIALASLEAEAVAMRWRYLPDGIHGMGEWNYRDQGYIDTLNAYHLSRQKELLYTAPPAPVSVPDAYVRDELGRMMLNGRQEPRIGYGAGWNGYRAAMLQGAEHVSNRDELKPDYLHGHKDGLEWAAQLAEANHPQTGDWLYDDPIELAKAIRKGPDMPELKSVPADADDNFYSWFGRFWSENYQQNNYTTSAKQMLGTMAEFAFRAGRESATQAGNSPVIPDEKGSSLQLRNLIRQRHAEWSQATFGDVGPVGPLKHLSKEALEAAAEPEDLSEWADMQFLLWDAQRRAGISDGEITAAMEEKLKVNMARQWPEPKDGEPRMHINPAPQQEVK